MHAPYPPPCIRVVLVGIASSVAVLRCRGHTMRSSNGFPTRFTVSVEVGVALFRVKVESAYRLGGARVKR